MNVEKLQEIKKCRYSLGPEEIDFLIETQEKLLEQNKLFRKRIFELRRKTGYQVYEENLRLAQEIERLKDDKDLFAKLFINSQLKE
jgi:hypothetical protein